MARRMKRRVRRVKRRRGRGFLSDTLSSFGLGRRRRSRRVGRRRVRGRGLFSSIWSGIKSAVRKPSTWLGAAGMIPSPLSLPLKVASGISGFAGHGRRRRRRVGRKRVGRRRMRGGAGLLGALSLGSLLRAAHSGLKSNRLVSRGLRHFGHNKLADIAHSLGYGRKRRRVRRRMRGRALNISPVQRMRLAGMYY